MLCPLNALRVLDVWFSFHFFSPNLQIVSTRFLWRRAQTVAMNFSKSKWRLAFLWAGTLALGAATLFGGLMACLDWAGQKDRARPADAIVVLGSRVRVGGVASPK